jgi:DegV family protein with EDD domain
MKPQKIALVTDSTHDLPQELIHQYNIRVVPLFIIWNGQELRDGVDIQADEFYKRLVAQPEAFPSTSQPSPQDFARVYQQAVDEGAEEIVVLTISSAMSGTFDSARQACQNFDIPILIHDTKANSMSIGWQLLAAARARENGASAQEMVQAADLVRQNLVYIISLNTLEYLRRGGRIGGAATFIGQLLNLKPQIYVNHQTGKVEAGAPSRTRKRAIETLYQSFFKQVDSSLPLRIAVLHNNALEDAERLAERIRQDFNPEELIISIVSPILGTHTGPEALALCGYSL